MSGKKTNVFKNFAYTTSVYLKNAKLENLRRRQSRERQLQNQETFDNLFTHFIIKEYNEVDI
jgi:hypothetical protein